ncbi:MAG: four helix bundle protein [Desulfobacterales bacterium]
MMEYWDHWCSIWLKNNTVHGINKPWIEKTSTEDLEYLNHLNISLGSCGEFHSCYTSCRQAEQITTNDYERLDQLHYKVENALLKLIESLQKKQTDKKWEDNFHSK